MPKLSCLFWNFWFWNFSFCSNKQQQQPQFSSVPINVIFCIFAASCLTCPLVVPCPAFVFKLINFGQKLFQSSWPQAFLLFDCCDDAACQCCRCNCFNIQKYFQWCAWKVCGQLWLALSWTLALSWGHLPEHGLLSKDRKLSCLALQALRRFFTLCSSGSIDYTHMSLSWHVCSAWELTMGLPSLTCFFLHSHFLAFKNQKK